MVANIHDKTFDYKGMSIHLKLISAEDILAADKGGTSDPYATAELIDSATGKPVKPARKTKTKTIKKTLYCNCFTFNI